MNDFMSHEPLDIEQKTRLTLTQHLAFKAACSDIGIKQSDVMRALILDFVRKHHMGKVLHSVGIETSAVLGTE